MNRKERLHKLKSDIAEKYYDSRCYICYAGIGYQIRKNGKTYLKGYKKGFTFHHKYYIKNDIHYKDYDNAEDYNQDLTIEITNQPGRFLLVCRACHRNIMFFENRPEKLDRLKSAILQTKTK